MENTVNYTKDFVLESIDKISIFDIFTPYEKQRLAVIQGGLVNFAPKTKFIVEGEKGTCLYILVSGSVHVSKEDVVLAVLGEGEIFGEMAFLTDTVRSTSVVSEGEVLVLKLDHDTMKQMSAEMREKIKDLCIEKLVERVKKTSARLKVRKIRGR